MAGARARIDAMKREVTQLIEQGRYDEVSALTVQLKAAELELGRGRSPMAAGGGDELTRQRSDQEREALAIALEEQAMAEAEEAQLAGELSRTRAAFAAACMDSRAKGGGVA